MDTWIQYTTSDHYEQVSARSLSRLCFISPPLLHQHCSKIPCWSDVPTCRSFSGSGCELEDVNRLMSWKSPLVAVSGGGTEAGYKWPFVCLQSGLRKGRRRKSALGFFVCVSLSALCSLTPMCGSIAPFPQSRRMAVILLCERSTLPRWP